MPVALARAKINPFLSVGDRRPDGYHDVDSVVLALDLADHLILADNAKPRLGVSGEPSPEGPENPVWRAAEALAPGKGWMIELTKMIPAGSGLGGEAADAAATLQALASLWHLDGTADLTAKAAQLGTEVPYFLVGGACRATGRGDTVQQLSWPGTFQVVVAVPQARIGEGDAFKWLDETPDRQTRSIDTFLAALGSDARRVASALWNDFDPIVSERVPAVKALKERLVALGALGSLVCAWGTGVFGLFELPENAAEAWQALIRDGYWAAHAATNPRATEILNF